MIETLYLTGRRTATELHTWNVIMSAWRSSLAILSLRYLFFGLPDPDLSSYMSRTSAPVLGSREAMPADTYFLSDEILQSFDEIDAAYPTEESIEGSHGDRLSPDSYSLDSFSSPLPSPRPADETISFDHWTRRYEIHNQATSELFHNLSALATQAYADALRFVLLPLMVLALVSRPDSVERALCLGLFARFKTLSNGQNTVPNPIGGSGLDFGIPWDRLDEYSGEMEQQRREDVVVLEPQLENSAPEWNWWSMLKRTNLQTVCKSKFHDLSFAIVTKLNFPSQGLSSQLRCTWKLARTSGPLVSANFWYDAW